MILQKKWCLVIAVILFMAQAEAHPPNDTTVLINAVGGLQYDLVRFKVKPGAKVKIIFTNKDDMSHNLVIANPDTRAKVVDAAIALGNEGAKMNYIPRIPEVLWSAPILSPGEAKTITFTAPKKEGIYPYVCTYPGHGFVMFGAMYVTDKAMPPMKDDPNIPPGRKKDVKGDSDHQDHSAQRAHSYREIPPYLYRIFMPDASPAAVAVNLPHNLSYCWDAGECRLRYAWQGDFIDNTDIWKGHHDSYGNILGAIFYRDKTAFPLQPDHPGNIPVVDFRGYRLINRYPEFHYTIDGIEVYELIKPKEDGTGLIRTFRIPETSRTIWFVFDAEDGMSYQSSSGKRVNNQLKLSPDEASQFTITMTKK